MGTKESSATHQPKHPPSQIPLRAQKPRTPPDSPERTKQFFTSSVLFRRQSRRNPPFEHRSRGGSAEPTEVGRKTLCLPQTQTPATGEERPGACEGSQSTPIDRTARGASWKAGFPVRIPFVRFRECGSFEGIYCDSKISWRTRGSSQRKRDGAAF